MLLECIGRSVEKKKNAELKFNILLTKETYSFIVLCIIMQITLTSDYLRRINTFLIDRCVDSQSRRKIIKGFRYILNSVVEDTLVFKQLSVIADTYLEVLSNKDEVEIRYFKTRGENGKRFISFTVQ